MNAHEEDHVRPLEILQQAGLRPTAQRAAILQFMIHEKRHWTADELFHQMRSSLPTLSLATVYNTLKAFVEAGVLKELTFGDAASRFDLNVSPHHHMVCDQCGRLQDIYLEAVPMNWIHEAEKDHQFYTRDVQIELHGLCQQCFQLQLADSSKRALGPMDA
jgi:Fur family peroxide stress response transcriptional regulator